MSFSTYQDMKPSGVSSIGEIPCHWECLRLRSVSGSPLSNGVGEASDRANPDDPRYIRITDISTTRSLRSDTFRSLPSEIAEKALVKKGDILLAAVGATFGKSYLHDSDVAACYAGYLVRYRAAEGIIADFISYFTESYGYWDQLNSNVIQSTVQNFSASRYGEVRTAIPPRDEQNAIAAFLDHEIGKIDDLISEQEQLITLLDEKRQAVISHAVTKGLNPDVEMKDSGIEWLGEVPAHWVKEPLSHIALKDGGVFIDGDWIESPEIVDEGIRYLTTGNVGQGNFKHQGNGHITEESFARLNCSEVRPGDILISRLNLPAGRACIVPDIAEIMVTAVDNVITRPSSAYDRRFLVYMLSSDKHYANTENMARGATMQRISRSALGKIRFAIPPVEEQIAIADYVEQEVMRLNDLSSLAEEGVTFLKERRSALISAAVTGKIDVRNHPAAVAALNQNKDN